MSLNVEQITSRLAQMPDAALQKYAAMNKNDPYIVALAVSESNRRKQMRQAAQAQQGQMQQPKVVDAAVQSMAQPMPEDTGIARLPAGDMNFANGGIVAFADGGEVERYNGSTGSLVSLTAEQLAKLYQIDPNLAQQARRGALTQTALRMASPALAAEAILAGGTALSADAAQTMAGMSPEQRRQFYSNPMVGATAGDAGIAGAILNAPDMAAPTMSYGDQMKNLFKAVPKTLGSGFKSLVSAPGYGLNSDLPPQDGSRPAATAKPGPTPQELAQFDAATDLYMTERAARQAKERGNAPKADATQRGPGTAGAPGAPGAPGANKAAAQDAGIAALDPTKVFEEALKKQRGEVRPEREMLEQLNRDKKSAAEQELASERALERRFADAYRGRRERLDTREAEFGKMKDQNFGLALLQAGAAMMSTRGNVGTAIGKGIQAGSQQYVAGIDKLNAARDKLADARDRLDDLQLNRDEMSARSIQKAENKIRDTAIAGQEGIIKYIMERDNVDRATASKIADNQIQVALTQAGFINRENVAKITAQPAIERNALLRLAQSKDDKVRTEYGKLQAKVMEDLRKDNNYTMATPAQQQVMQTNALRQALMNNPFLSAYAANVGFSSTPTGGKVYDLTEP